VELGIESDEANVSDAPLDSCEIYRLNAFTDAPFGGNPTLVCVLDDWPSDAMMQAMASEWNLSETAFVVRHSENYDIRWFTPIREIEICGHATLASAAVVMDRLLPGRESILFYSRSGPLPATRSRDLFEIRLPAFPARPIRVTDELANALGARPSLAMESNRTFAVLENAELVRSLAPDLPYLARVYPNGFGVTAPGTGLDSDVDFVTRYFAPAKGVPEDPVTGSVHCALTPFWAGLLKRPNLKARQVSKRVGELTVSDLGSHVALAGNVRFVFEGTLSF
jgi:PhzF family phenazine biosynthesis protein